MKIIAAKKILKANEQLAAENRSQFDAAGVFAVNLVGSPGCGKTTLLEALFGQAGLAGRLAPAVIEGDIAGSIDAQRIDAIGVPVVQINTEGACHLDASMIAAAKEGLGIRDWGRAGGDPESPTSSPQPLVPSPQTPAVRLLVIENVGNLVCPTGYDLGEDEKVAVLSVAEGDEKPIKYPGLFVRAGVVLINKIDLLPYTNFSMDRAVGDIRKLHAAATVFPLSCRTGEGFAAWCEYLGQKTRVT